MTERTLSKKEEDIQRLIMSGCYLGAKTCTKPMAKYVYKRKSNGVYMFNVERTWEKLMAAARIIASVPDTSTVIAISGRPYGQRAVYKFAQHTNTSPVTGRWTPGMLTNQNTKKYVEPRLLILTDPRIDYNALLESSYMNIPIIALTNTDNGLSFVDCAIPCNNRSKKSLAMIYWILTREVKILKGELKENEPWNELPDMFLYRDPERAAEVAKANENQDLGNADDDVKEQEEEGGDDEGGYGEGFN